MPGFLNETKIERVRDFIQINVVCIKIDRVCRCFVDPHTAHAMIIAHDKRT